MKIPLEYGDNFPVAPPGAWNPAVPWRFPNTEIRLKRSSPLSYVLPWITLGLGVTAGILWMSWRTDLPAARPALEQAPEKKLHTGLGEVLEALPLPREPVPPVTPESRPARVRSELA